MSAGEMTIVEHSAQVPVGDSDVEAQVVTARRYPRSITKFMQKAQEMATLTPDIAVACIYALPRKENGKVKNIEGPSARLAEICASAWGNIRAEGKVLGHDDTFVTARGTTWDVENNVAIAYEVRRRITDREGRTYNADMIGVTGNACASIALRNSILKVIPTPFWKPIYLACRKVVAGDAATFQVRRDNMFKEFAIMGVTEERLCAAVDVRGKLDITLEHMATLAGFFTALKDGETTIEDAFPDGGGLSQPQPAQRKSQAPPATTTPASATPVQAAAAPTPKIGTVKGINEMANGTMVTLSTGFKCATRDAETIRALRNLQQSGATVELVTLAAPSGEKYAPVIQEVIPQ